MMETFTSGNDRDGMISVKEMMSCQSETRSHRQRTGRAGFLLFVLLVLAPFERVALASDAKEIYDQAVNASYNLDFNIAERGYETLTRDYPDNPDYWNALASAIWVRITFNQQKLNIESFSGTTLGTRDSKDNVNPDDEKRLRDTVAIAIQKADAILKK